MTPGSPPVCSWALLVVLAEAGDAIAAAGVEAAVELGMGQEDERRR